MADAKNRRRARSRMRSGPEWPSRLRTQIDVRSLKPGDRLTGAVREEFSRILRGSFPADQREKVSVVLANVRSGRRQCFIARVGERLVGLGVLQELSGLNIFRLEYLAVAKECRDNGIGGELFDRICWEYRDAAGMIFEVDSPSSAKGKDREICERRIAFYRRHGAELVRDAPSYEAPTACGERSLRYDLMWHPLGERSQVSELSGELLEDCVVAILTQCYELRRTDAFVRRAVRRLSG